MIKNRITKENWPYTPWCLLRISNKTFNDNLLKKGEIYMNTLRYFRELGATNEEQGDPYEGFAYLKKVDKIVFRKREKTTFEIYPNNGDLLFDYPKNIGNAFCSFGIDQHLMDNKLRINIPKKIYKTFLEKDEDFSGIVIYNPQEFVRRIRETLYKIDTGFNVQFNPITYLAFDRDMEIGPFVKRKRYAYQHEYRIFVSHKNKAIETPLHFFINSIEDIAMEVRHGESYSVMELRAPRRTNIVTYY